MNVNVMTVAVMVVDVRKTADVTSLKVAAVEADFEVFPAASRGENAIRTADAAFVTDEK